MLFIQNIKKLEVFMELYYDKTIQIYISFWFSVGNRLSIKIAFGLNPILYAHCRNLRAWIYINLASDVTDTFITKTQCCCFAGEWFNSLLIYSGSVDTVLHPWKLVMAPYACQERFSISALKLETEGIRSSKALLSIQPSQRTQPISSKGPDIL